MKILDRIGLARDSDLTLGTFLERLATVHADRALVEEDSEPQMRLTFAGGADLVARWAGAVEGRITAGDRVVIATPNSYRMLLMMLAVCRAGGVAVPVNPKMRPGEITHVINDSGATVVINDEA